MSISEIAAKMLVYQEDRLRIKGANLLPSLVFAVAAAFIPLSLFSM